MFRSNRQSGITLIELMTVIVIVSILVSVAVPSYRSYLIRTQRSDAKTVLLTLRAAQEKFYLQYNRYTDNVTARADADPPGLGLRNTSDNGLYTVSVDLRINGDESSNQGYTASATPVEGRGQTDDVKCLVMTLTDVGLRGASGPGGPEYCWR